MRDAMNRGGPVVAIHQKSTRKQRRRITSSCSICARRIWFDPISIHEPEGVPVPRNSWVLCKECHGLLMTEFRRSPVRSPLRLRIAMGLIAAERSPYAYGVRTYLRDQRRFLGIAWVLIVAMLL